MKHETSLAQGVTSPITGADELLLAALLLNRRAPMLPHHVAAVRERLWDTTDADLLEWVRTGKRK